MRWQINLLQKIFVFLFVCGLDTQMSLLRGWVAGLFILVFFQGGGCGTRLSQKAAENLSFTLRLSVLTCVNFFFFALNVIEWSEK